MPLEPGTTLGTYSVAVKIGEGGMGEVYRARDTKLDRDAALKVVPQAFTDDPDRLARFEREELGDFRGHAHPAWFGDDYLVFVGSAETRGVATRREEMLLMDRRIGETELLFNDGPAWTFEEQMVASPDGRWLYFIRQELESDIWLQTRER